MQFRYPIGTLAIGAMLSMPLAAQEQHLQTISAGIVVDVSGSMAGKLHRARQLTAELLKAASVHDEFSLVQASDRAVLMNGFVSKTDEIQNHLTYAQARGRSALLDAIYLSLQQARTARNRQKVLLVLSDGDDNNSHFPIEEITNLARQGRIQVFSVGFEPFAERGAQLLPELARATDARHFTVERTTDMARLAAEINTALRGTAPVQ